jgi:hypothetical protein
MGTNNLPAVISSAAQAQGLTLTDVNLIMPTETFGAVLGQFDKITIETVRVNTQDAREVYEPGGKGKGFALGKVPLQSIASALSIQWHPQYTGIVESSARRSRAKAVGIMRKPNGETITQTEEKTIDLDVEEEDLREKEEKNAQGGRVKEWVDNRPVKVPWKDEAERLEYIEREVKKSIKQKRRFKDELAMTGAKDRVIRAFLALKSTYTAVELSKPIAFPRVTTDTSKMLADPMMRAAAIGMIAPATAMLYGKQPETFPEVEAPVTDASPEVELEREDPPMRPAEGQRTTTAGLAAQAAASEDLDAAFAVDADVEPIPTSLSETDQLVQALTDYVETNMLPEAGMKLIQEALDRGERNIETLRDLVGRAKKAYEAVEAKRRALAAGKTA